MKDIFRYQHWHLLSIVILVALIYSYVSVNSDTLNGVLWEVNARVWFWIAILVPVIHQYYVWFVWRMELYRRSFTSRYGLMRSFRVYAAGFSFLFLLRLISIIILAVSNKDTLQLNPYFSYLLSAIIIPIVAYLFYSVKKYFTIERAYGIDHFDENYNQAYVKKGIFRFTNNGMYIYGLMILYLPGLLFFSKAALIAALFNHIYIWVHYYCTERPDMKVIYGKAPEN